MRLYLILLVSSAVARVYYHVPKQMKKAMRQVQRNVYAQDESDPGHELIKTIRLMKPKPTNSRQKMMTINGMEFYIYE